MQFDLTQKLAEVRARRGTPQEAAASFVQGWYVQSEAVVESHRGTHDKRNSQLALGSNVGEVFGGDIDIKWLEAASETYQVSADPRDYVLVEVPLVTVDIPNRNLQGFPYEEVSYFDPLFGRLIYSTFVGKPTHQDHDNKNLLKVKGVNFDAVMRFVPAYNVWKIFVLSGFDRTKDSWLANQILTKKRTGYSMGALVESFVCSYCGAIDTNIKKCRCMTKGKGIIINGSLVYQLCVGANFIENSSVEDPADVTANTEIFWS
jgi:hypothetical protein